MPTTALAHRRNDTPSNADGIDDLRGQLQVLVEAGDVAALTEVARDAEPAALLLRKRGYDAEANEVMCLKIEAEAGLGELERRGTQCGASQYEKRRRAMFAVAADRGVLGRELARAKGECDLSPEIFSRNLRRIGVGGVTAATLIAAMETWTRDTGLELRPNGGRWGAPPNQLTIGDLASRAGMSVMTVRRALGRERASASRRTKRIDWWTAKRLGEYFGVDPTSWPLAPDSRGGRRQPQRWLKRQVKPTGGRWDECYSRFRKTLDEFQRLAPNTDIRWDDAYSHFYALNAAIEKQVRKA